MHVYIHIHSNFYIAWLYHTTILWSLRDHPKSYMWDKKGNPYRFIPGPLLHTKWKKFEVLSHTSTCIPLICVHLSWFTFIIFNFKYYLGEWYYHRNWLLKHFIHVHVKYIEMYEMGSKTFYSCPCEVYRNVWNGFLTPCQPFLQSLSFCIPHATFCMVPNIVRWLVIMTDTFIVLCCFTLYILTAAYYLTMSKVS